MVGNGYSFWIRHEGNVGRKNSGVIAQTTHIFPKNFESDNETYLAGAREFDIKEVECYQVIGRVSEQYKYVKPLEIGIREANG